MSIVPEETCLAQVVLEAEISREQVPLRNAYRHVGQKASVRVNSGVEYTVPGKVLLGSNSPVEGGHYC